MKPDSRSDRVAMLATSMLDARGFATLLVRLRDFPLPPFDDHACYRSEAYGALHNMTQSADSIVLAGPVYNWACCAELKKYVEAVGSTPPDNSRQGAFFDKVVSFALAAGLPHSYMAAGATMVSMILDFRCIVNPRQAYLHNRHWTDAGELVEEGYAKVAEMVDMHADLATRLAGRERRSEWSV